MGCGDGRRAGDLLSRMPFAVALIAVEGLEREPAVRAYFLWRVRHMCVEKLECKCRKGLINVRAAAAVCMLCALRQLCEGCHSTPPGRVVPCVHGAARAVCVWRSHTPQIPEYCYCR